MKIIIYQENGVVNRVLKIIKFTKNSVSSYIIMVCGIKLKTLYISLCMADMELMNLEIS